MHGDIGDLCLRQGLSHFLLKPRQALTGKGHQLRVALPHFLQQGIAYIQPQLQAPKCRPQMVHQPCQERLWTCEGSAPQLLCPGDYPLGQLHQMEIVQAQARQMLLMIAAAGPLQVHGDIADFPRRDRQVKGIPQARGKMSRQFILRAGLQPGQHLPRHPDFLTLADAGNGQGQMHQQPYKGIVGKLPALLCPLLP